MDSQYGIAVRNKFELFLDDDADPLEILRVQEEEKKKKKDDTVKGKDAKSQKDSSKSAKNKKNKALTSTQEQKPKFTDPKEQRREGNNTLFIKFEKNLYCTLINHLSK